jgi:hypothetical protein
MEMNLKKGEIQTENNLPAIKIILKTLTSSNYLIQKTIQKNSKKKTNKRKIKKKV